MIQILIILECVSGVDIWLCGITRLICAGIFRIVSDFV